MTKAIAILGSTGSIGKQTLEVVDQHYHALRVVALAASSNWKEMLKQIKKYKPSLVALMDPLAAEKLEQALYEQDINVTVAVGLQGLTEVATHEEAHTIVTAVSGAIGLGPTLAAIEKGKNIALANKETLVAAGALVMEKVKEKGVSLLPVDSEHSAIFQCLQQQDCQQARLLLTASGGPFRDKSLEDLQKVTAEDALRHPNWRMGSKITIDSATLMNKGLEVIEARWLFDIDFDRIDVLIHPQSIIHSMVEFADSSVIAQLGHPDMRLPIQYALSYPQRWDSQWPRLDLTELAGLTFHKPDYDRFPALQLALQAGRADGTMPTVMNAANEVAVHAFLDHKIAFMDIPRIVKGTMEKHNWVAKPKLKDIQIADQWAREFAEIQVNPHREVSQ
ncbi:1-deoxy-D-xylulose-5-phosphate reductoisomerase [Heliorestis acidaminivorans]|uniref:1-deoxy-D-xylulose 5-phosphate reductoisomerase n=1 Tax=Heliorestis acidaminivorans TaxID=553427 RepID=A0A6I0EVE9_9FIRM|nr:1-deoxy-D-xylulose-5-phosphate reductoisomerase [Heliorestis acidaminivorans]KAB2954364.1 1-deoxy-D-xylulose-5-phosphate reductoisomerase [Heliorestis acidaminivorans]